MGASHVDFVGLDGFKSIAHSFEKSKLAPHFNDDNKFKKQMKIFCQYMIDDLQVETMKNFSENSENSIYAGILTEVKNEKN